jgi:hypothetical protein
MVDNRDTKKLLELLKAKIQRRKSKSRSKLLRNLLKAIDEGKIDSSSVPKDLLFSQKTPREQYLSPYDRSSPNNYGEMNIGEIGAGTSNVW